MRARKAKTEIRREQIAHAALRLLAVHGWQGVSLAAIAREVGVVTSGVYRHFRDKDDVLDAVLELVDQSFQKNLQAARVENEKPLAQLQDVLERHVALILSGVPVPRIVLSEEVFSGNPRHRQRTQRIYQDYLVAIAAIIREGQGQGQIRHDVGADSLAVMWLGLVQSPAILWLLGKSDFDLKNQCERAWEIFARALQPDRT